MVAITLTQTEGGSEVCTVNGTVVYGSKFNTRRLNTSNVETADGGLITTTSGVKLVEGEIHIKNVSKSDGEVLRHFLLEHVLYGTYKFTISAVVNLNLGTGDNTAVTNAQCPATDDASIFTYVVPGQYDIILPYRAKAVI